MRRNYVLVLLLGIFLLATAAYILWVQQNREVSVSVTNTQLSERAAEFLTTQTTSTSGTSTQTSKAASQIVTPCFSVHLTIPLRNTKSESTDTRCSVQTTSDDPHSRITITAEETPISLLTDIPAVKMRLNSDMYVQSDRFITDQNSEKIIIGPNEVVYFKLSENTLRTVALHDLNTVDARALATFETILTSIAW